MRYVVRNLSIRKTADGDRYFSETKYGPASLEACAEYLADYEGAGGNGYIWPVADEGHPVVTEGATAALPSAPVRGT